MRRKAYTQDEVMKIWLVMKMRKFSNVMVGHQVFELGGSDIINEEPCSILDSTFIDP